jgi:tetratricopeptide (TPR) repeat protein
LLIIAAAGLAAYGGLRASSPTAPNGKEIVWLIVTAAATAILTILQIRPDARHGEGKPHADLSLAGNVSWLSQLPPVVPDFVDRRAEIRMIMRWLTRRSPGPAPAPRIVAISGQGGVGKTTLAIYAAHRIATRFGDGQIYVNLRGAERVALRPMEVLDAVLRGLGVDGASIPNDLDGRSALYRSLMSGRQVLLLLDNAVDEAQVRPLIPGAPQCATLITSRGRLSGIDGACHVELDVFDKDAALELLEAIVGAERIDSERESVDEVLGMLGALPLAVRIAGARLAAKPHWKVSTLRTRLLDERRRVHELSPGDQGLWACFLASYEGLTPRQAQAFRLISVSDAKDLEAWAIAALIDAPTEDAEELVEALADARLMEATHAPDRPHRYGFHDLLRAFARDLFQQHTDRRQVTSAIDHLAAAYLANLVGANQRLLLAAPRHRITSLPEGLWPADAVARAAPATLHDALAWFDQERTALLLTIRQAHEAGLDERCWRLAVLATALYEEGSYWNDWLSAHRLAEKSARRMGDEWCLAVSEWCLGRVHHYLGAWEDTLTIFRSAESRFRRLGDDRLVALVMCGIGKVYQLGQFDRALEYLAGATEELTRLGDRHAAAYAKANLADVYHLRGELDAAVAYFNESMTVLREVGDDWWLSNAGIWLGDTYRLQGHGAAAMSSLTESYRTFAKLGDRRRGAVALVHLGDAWFDREKTLRALHAYSVALDVFREFGDRWWRARAAHGMGKAYAALRIYPAAVAHLSDALPVFQALGNDRLESQVKKSLGQVTGRRAGSSLLGALYKVRASLALRLAYRAPMM